jgi:hypothetical protein
MAKIIFVVLILMKPCVVAVYAIVDAVVVMALTNTTKRAWIGFRGIWPCLTPTASPAFV